MPHPSVSVDETINGWYSDLQAGTHTINGYRKAMYTCEVCWNSWDGEELGTELVSRVENHEFVEDGFCFWCNFPISAHTNIRKPLTMESVCAVTGILSPREL